MGCVFVGSQALYAIHIPDNDPERNGYGGRTFAEFVLVPEKKTKGGELFVFVNGNNRPSAEEEAKAIGDILKKPTTVIRIINHLDRNDGLPRNSATILVERQDADGVAMKYKYVPDAQWEQGGKGKSGIYESRQEGNFGAPTVPNAAELTARWHDVDTFNCILKVIR